MVWEFVLMPENMLVKVAASTAVSDGRHGTTATHQILPPLRLGLKPQPRSNFSATRNPGAG